jgi:hypothetical protein
VTDPLEGADHGPDVTEPDGYPAEVADRFVDCVELLARAERAEREAA